MTGLDLAPRAITVLVALRAGLRARAGLADILCDDTVAATDALLADMVQLGLIQRYSREFPRTWLLTHDGLSWLQRNGLDATDRAKREIAEADNNKRAEDFMAGRGMPGGGT